MSAQTSYATTIFTINRCIRDGDADTLMALRRGVIDRRILRQIDNALTILSAALAGASEV